MQSSFALCLESFAFLELTFHGEWHNLASHHAVVHCVRLAKHFRAKGYQENDKTVAMAPLGFLNEDVKTAGSTKDIRVDFIYPDSPSF